MNINKLFVIGAVLIIVGAGWFAFSDPSIKDGAIMQKGEDAMIVEKTSDAMMQKDKTVPLVALNDSKEEGVAVFSDIGGKTKVTVTIAGAPAGVSQPMHIHTGSCPTPGTVTYPLVSLVDGKSETILDVPLATLLSRLPLAINVHKSMTELKSYVSCGDISLESEAMMQN